jgi:D-xylose transport system substrate-binding protein
MIITKRKQLFFYILIFSFFTILTSCSQRAKVGFLMDLSKTGRWAKDKELFIKSVRDLGGEVITRASEGVAEKQYELAKELLVENVKVLVVIPSDMNSAANIVKLAHQHKVPVISYDRIIKNCPLDFYISFDNVHVGELQAQYLSTVCPKGKYAILGGAVNDNNAFLIRLGQLNIIQPLVQRGDIEIVFDEYAGSWTVEEGYRLFEECIKKNPKVDAVLAANDQIAEGALKAMQEAGMNPLPYLSGQDADANACKRIIAGTQTMTVYKPIEAIATKAAEIAMQIIHEQHIPKTMLSVNNGQKQVPAILLPPMIVNKETIDLTVIADGYLKENNLTTDASNR